MSKRTTPSALRRRAARLAKFGPPRTSIAVLQAEVATLKARIAELESVPTYRIEPIDLDAMIREQDEEESRGGI